MVYIRPRVGTKAKNIHISKNDGKYWYFPENTGKYKLQLHTSYFFLHICLGCRQKYTLLAVTFYLVFDLNKFRLLRNEICI